MDVFSMNKAYCIGILFLIIGFFSSCSFTEASGTAFSEPSQLKFRKVQELYDFLTYSERRFPLVSAHRGGPEPGYPENAIETFEHSASKQPLIIECDVALSEDSILVMMHDDRLERTTSGRGLVQQKTLRALKQLYLKDNEGKLTHYRIPTLDEVLAWAKDKVILTLDVKKGVPFDLVIAAIRRQAAEAYSIVITYNATQALEVYRLAPDLMISVNVRQMDDLIRLNDYGIPDNRLIAFVGVREPDTALYQHLHRHGIMCILGTIGNLDKRAAARGDSLYKQWIDKGADILATDRPMAAGLQLARYRQAHR